MQKIIDYIEIFQKYKKYITSKRFLPLIFSLILTCVIFNFNKIIQGWFTWSGYLILLIIALISIVFSYCWAFYVFPWEKSFLSKKSKLVDDYEITKAENAIYDNYLFITYRSKLDWLFIKLKLCSISGQTKLHYETILEIEEHFLLPKEEQILLVKKTDFYRKYQNVRDLKQTIDKLEKYNCLLDHRDYVLYVINKSYEKELRGDITEAKKEVMELLKQVNYGTKISIYNNIARLEEVTFNYNNAIHYYEKAEKELSTNPINNLFHIVLYNLVIINSKIKHYAKSIEWLNIYFKVIPKDNLNVLLEFYNTKVELARQLGDRKMLIDAYNEMDTNIEPYLDRDSWFNYFRTKLRMSFNDDINFDKNIIKAQDIFDELVNLDFPKNYFAIKEIFCILNIIFESGYTNNFKDLDKRTLDFMNNILPKIKEYRKNIPDLAFSEQWFWLNEIINLKKLSFQNKANYDNFNEFFNSLKELTRNAKDNENIYYEVKSYMIICDEYVTYSKSLNEKFADDFRSFAEESLENAINIVEKNKSNPHFYEYFLTTAYYLKTIKNDTEEARKLLEIFDEKKINPNHYALWLRQYYNKLKSKL